MKKYCLAALLISLAAVLAACTTSPEVLPESGAENETAAEMTAGEENADAENEEQPAADEDEAEAAEEETEPAEEANEENVPEESGDSTDAAADWKSTYAAALWIYASGEQYTPDCRFSLAYIDGDDIPELLIHRGSDHASGVEIYAYLDGGLINVSTEDTPNEFGAYGSLSYAEKGNVIASNYRAMGDHTCDLYTLDDTRAAVLTRSYYDNEDITDVEPVFQIDGEDVSAADYHAAFDADNADLALADYESAYEFTSENYVALF